MGALALSSDQCPDACRVKRYPEAHDRVKGAPREVASEAEPLLVVGAIAGG